MFKYQQKQILELLKTLDEAHEELNKKLEANVLSALLGDCQEFAMKLMDYIEELEGSDVKAIGLLEEYCKLLYSLSQDYNNAGRKALRRKFSAIEHSVSKMPVRYEVVFLMSNVATWDCMETVWEAASNDDRFDVYTLALPHPGMSGEAEYLSQTVPLTDWSDYDLEARHPDIIFVHDPWDKVKYPPQFHLERFAECTDLLVYLPYALSWTNISEDPVPEAVNKMFVSGSFVTGRRHKLLKQVASKFVALGNPKCDIAIRNHKTESIDYPNEWTKLLFNEDGTKKTVVFYNISVDQLRKGPKALVDKIEYVLGQFKLRKDVLPLWRPHPLFAQHISAHDKEQEARYHSLVSDFKLEGYGIYDDSKSAHMAITFSDVHYGSPGSILDLFQCVGKPVVIQCATMTKAPETVRHVKQYFDEWEHTMRTAVKFEKCAFHEQVGTLFCDFFEIMDYLHSSPMLLEELREKQIELSEQVNGTGDAGRDIWDYCRKSVLGKRSQQ